MAHPRSGAFGGSLSPFGQGSFSNLGQYSIGKDLADLAIYEAEIGWGNGTVSDAEYLAALQRGVDATDVGSHERVSAINKQQDAQYRIGRQVASLAGLDQVIAFDQSSLASMNPDNLKYRSVQENLAGELAQRRGRDYGKLVTDYNAGHGSTQSLLNWVNTTLAGLPTGAPDADNWASVKSDLTQRLQTETDAEVYQDYQHNRIKGPAFLAYVKGRRDSYDPNSPDFADWSRKLEDATKSVVDTAQGKKDQAFFDSYNAGHKSDKQYLLYLSNRVKTMDPNDPSLPQWKQRLTQAAHSIAEDELRFAVQTGKRPVSALVSFYQHYRRTLNPQSPEYRQVTRAIMALSGSSGGGGGGGGGAGPGKVTVGGDAAAGLIGGGKTPATTTHPTDPAAGLPGHEQGPLVKGQAKVISPKYTLDSILHLMAVNPALPDYGPHPTKAQKAAIKNAKRNQKAAQDSFDLNHASLMNAVQRGDATWFFYDPRKPLGSKPVELPTSGTALANMDMLEAQFQTGLASIAMGHHDAQGYYKALTRASNAQDAARVHYGQAVISDDRPLFKQAQTGIDLAMATGDFATALNLANDLQARVKQDMTLPGLDDTRRAELQTMLDKLANNPLLPTTDGNGNLVMRGADIAGSPTRIDPVTGRRVFTDVSLAQGYHLVLDNAPLGSDGTPPWKLSFDGAQDGTWEQDHVTIQTSYGDRVVTGDVKIGQAKVSPSLLITGGAGGDLLIDKPPPGLIQSITYTDQSGQIITAYSSDGGATWVKPEPGQTLPMLDLEAPGLTAGEPNADGSVDYYSTTEPSTDALSNPVYSVLADGSVKINPDYTNAHTDQVGFLNVARALNDAPKLAKYTGLSKSTETIASLSNPNRKRNLDRTQSDASVAYTGDGAIDPHTGRLAYDVGAPGQQMTVIAMSPSGSLNLTTPVAKSFSQIYDEYKAAQIQTISPTGLGGNFYTPTLPSTAQQLPADTPDRYNGLGLGIGGTLGPVVNIPKLNTPTVPGAVAPLKYKTSTAPPPLKVNPKITSSTTQRNLDRLVPTPKKPKPVEPSKPLRTANPNTPTRL